MFTTKQLKPALIVALIATIALHTWVIVGVLTIPLGIGLIMLVNSSPWILNLYPFLFAAKGHSSAPVYYLDTSVSLPITVIQWAGIALLAGHLLENFTGFRRVLAALATPLIVGAITSGVVSALNIKLMWASAHM